MTQINLSDTQWKLIYDALVAESMLTPEDYLEPYNEILRTIKRCVKIDL